MMYFCRVVVGVYQLQFAKLWLIVSEDNKVGDQVGMELACTDRMMHNDVWHQSHEGPSSRVELALPISAYMTRSPTL